MSKPEAGNGEWIRFCEETGRDWKQYSNVHLFLEFAEWSQAELAAARNTDDDDDFRAGVEAGIYASMDRWLTKEQHNPLEVQWTREAALKAKPGNVAPSPAESYDEFGAESKSYGPHLVSNLVRLVRRLAMKCPDSKTKEQALDYLNRKGFSGSPLRDESGNVAPSDCEWMSFSRGGLGYCACGKLGSQSNMVPYAAYEAHLSGNPENPVPVAPTQLTNRKSPIEEVLKLLQRAQQQPPIAPTAEPLRTFQDIDALQSLSVTHSMPADAVHLPVDPLPSPPTERLDALENKNRNLSFEAAKQRALKEAMEKTNLKLMAQLAAHVARKEQLEKLAAEWEGNSAMYLDRYMRSTERNEYIIAGQQAGLKTAFKVCAAELRALLAEK